MSDWSSDVCSSDRAALHRQRAQYALADAAVGDADACGGPQVDDALENRAARDDQIGALAADAGDFGAVGDARVGETAADLAHSASGSASWRDRVGRYG